MVIQMKVTHITAAKFRKNFRTLSVEDCESFKIHEEVLFKNGLEVGQELSEDQYKKIRLESTVKEAEEYAIHLFSYRALSESALFQRLKRKGFPVEAAMIVLSLMKERKLLNDLDLAKNLAESRFRRLKSGDARIQRDLVQKGIPPKIAEAAMQEVQETLKEDLPSEDERAYQTLLKRRSQIRDKDNRAIYRRLYDYLVRRGFDADSIERWEQILRSLLTIAPGAFHPSLLLENQELAQEAPPLHWSLEIFVCYFFFIHIFIVTGIFILDIFIICIDTSLSV